MKILVDTNSIVLSAANRIELGVFDEPIEKWIVEDEELGYKFYCIDNQFKVIEIQKVPNDFKDMKYCYTEEKGFYINENYSEPINAEDEMKRLIQENIDLKAQLDKVQEVLDYLVMQ